MIKAIQKADRPIKWPKIARTIIGRTGKQCRERYLNHLSPRVKSKAWTPVEDCTLIHLHCAIGSQWCRIANHIPGRSDNSLKNRFHNIRRRLEKEVAFCLRSCRGHQPNDKSQATIGSPMNSLSSEEQGAQRDLHHALEAFASRSLLHSESECTDSYFGPFKAAIATGVQCTRCGFFSPSLQCGSRVCQRTGWCDACTKIPTFLCGNSLRRCLMLRQAKV